MKKIIKAAWRRFSRRSADDGVHYDRWLAWMAERYVPGAPDREPSSPTEWIDQYDAWLAKRQLPTVRRGGVSQVIRDVEEAAAAGRKANASLDEVNTTNDYLAYAMAYAGRAAINCGNNQRDGYATPAARRELLVKAAGLLVNAAAAIDAS